MNNFYIVQIVAVTSSNLILFIPTMVLLVLQQAPLMNVMIVVVWPQLVLVFLSMKKQVNVKQNLMERTDLIKLLHLILYIIRKFLIQVIKLLKSQVFS